jgi:hypothetical protein
MGWLGNLWRDVTGVTAANTAAQAQRDATSAAMQTLSPYSDAGTGAISQMQALSGAAGADAQAQALAGIENSPMFQGLVQQGESALLQNAAATGGLRGGNTAAALAQFRPQMLNQQIQQQMQNLGGIAGMGMNANSQTAGLQGTLGDIDAANAMSNYNLQKGFIGDVAGMGLSLATGGIPGVPPLFGGDGLFSNLFGGGGSPYNPGSSATMTTGIRAPGGGGYTL